MAINECCTKPENLIPQPTDRPDLTVRVCRVCGNRHFELSVDKGEIGLRGASLSG
jgi:hypothetical protein